MQPVGRGRATLDSWISSLRVADLHDQRHSTLVTWLEGIRSALAALDADAGIEKLPGTGGTKGRYCVTFREGGQGEEAR